MLYYCGILIQWDRNDKEILLNTVACHDWVTLRGIVVILSQ